MRGRHSYNRCSRAAAIFLSLIMIVTLSAQTAQAVAVPMKARPVPELSQIREMLEGRSYTEGDAIVVAEKGFDPAGFIEGDSEKLAEASEESLTLTADAARETDDAAHEVMAKRADASYASSYNVSKVHSDTMDTAELIAKLYTSPKVISAEPNFVFDAAEAYALEESEETPAPDDPDGKENVSDQTGGESGDDPAAEENADDQSGEENAGNQAGKENAGDQAGMYKADDQAGKDYKENKDNKDDSGKTPSAELTKKSGLSSTGQHDADVGDLSSAQWYLKDGSTINTLEGFGDGNVSLDVPGYNGSGRGDQNSSEDSTIAILDSGMDVTHPDLKNQFYTFSPKQQAKYGCGKHGLNATAEPGSEEVGDLTDPVDHGTHCSGIMVANWDGKGVAGVANGAKLVGVRLSEKAGNQTLEGNLRGFNFLINCASDINLKSVNCSWGADAGVVEFTYTLLVNELGRHGVVTVFAAGNELNDLDQKIETPSFIDSPYLLTVDSMNPRGDRSGFSNYGETMTDVFAPGSDIMSTVPATVESLDPAGDPVVTTYSRYHPESGQGVIERITFSEQDMGSLVQVFEHNPLTTEGETSVGYDIADSGTDDRASMMIERKHFKNPKLTDEDIRNLPGDSVFLRVKVGNGVDPENIKMITTRVATEFGLSSVIGTLYGFAAENTSTNKIRMATLGYDKEGRIFSAQARGSVSAWGTATVNADDLLAEDEHVYVDDDGYIYLWLGVTEQRADYERPDYIYLDDITIGKGGSENPNENAHASAHIVFNGTSMAAPTVTAALAIVSRDEDPNSDFPEGEGEGTLGMQALKRSARLRAATRREEHLEECCATGGFVRLTSFKSGSTEDKPLAPIIASCGQTDNTSKKIEVNGWFFGDRKGSSVITVDGKSADVVSWTDEKIVIKLPAGTGNGAHVLRMQTADGIDKAPFSTSYDDPSVSKPGLYEYELSVPDALAPDPDGNDGKIYPCLVATGDCIYTLQKDLNSKIIAVWRYNIPSDKWDMVKLPTKAEMRVQYGTVMAATSDGFVLLASEQTGVDKYGNPVMTEYLYYYNAGSGSWSRKTVPEGIGSGTAIFTRGDDLYFAGICRKIKVNGKERLSVLEVLRKGSSGTEILGTLPVNYGHGSFLSNCLAADCGGYVYLLGQEPIGGSYPFSYALTRFRLDENDRITEVHEFFGELAKAGIIKKGVWDSSVAMSTIGCGVVLINREKKGTDTMILENGSNKFREFDRTSSFYRGNSQMAVHYGDYLYVFGYSPSEPGKMFFRATKLVIEHSWDKGKVTREPTPKRPGELTYTCTRCGLVHTEEIPFEGYVCVYGDGSEWLRGSRDPLIFRFVRLPEDEAYERYQRILVDGKELSEKNFDIEKGSLVVKLKASYLETLSDGDHKITAEFNDGSADASFAVVRGSHKVNTGDGRSIGTWLILLIVSVAALGALTVRRTRT